MNWKCLFERYAVKTTTTNTLLVWDKSFFGCSRYWNQNILQMRFLPSSLEIPEYVWLFTEIYFIFPPQMKTIMKHSSCY